MSVKQLVPSHKRVRGTVGEVLDFYVSSPRLEKKRSYKLVRSRIFNHLDPLLGHVKAKKLPEADLWNFVEVTLGDRYGEERRKRFDGTVCGCLRILKAALNYYWTKKRIDAWNPAECIGILIAETRQAMDIPDQTQREPYTVEEFAMLLGYAKRMDTTVYDWLQVAGATGLRLGEILGLEWRTIDWKNARIPGNSQMWAIDTMGEPVRPKSRRTASIWLPDHVMDLLRRRRRSPLVSSRWVFTTEEGKTYTTRKAIDMTLKVRRAAAKSGVPLDKSFHCIRHLFASMALENGADLQWVSGALAHSTSVITARTYAHVLERRRDVSWTNIEPMEATPCDELSD